MNNGCLACGGQEFDESGYCRYCLSSYPEKTRVKGIAKMIADVCEYLECPECSGEVEEVEGAFMNELGEAEYRGYQCKECTWREEE